MMEDTSMFSDINDPFSMTRHSIDIIPFGISFGSDSSLLSKDDSQNELNIVLRAENKENISFDIHKISKSTKKDTIEVPKIKVEIDKRKNIETEVKIKVERKTQIKVEIETQTDNHTSKTSKEKPKLVNPIVKKIENSNNHCAKQKSKENLSKRSALKPINHQINTNNSNQFQRFQRKAFTYQTHSRNRYIPYNYQKMSISQCFYEKSNLRRLMGRIVEEKNNFMFHQYRINHEQIVEVQRDMENKFYYQCKSQMELYHLVNNAIENVKNAQFRSMKPKIDEFEYKIKEISEAIKVMNRTIQDKRRR